MVEVIRKLKGLLRDGWQRSRSDERVTVYLHVGMPKTGTTAIQRYLFDNRAQLLKEQGVYYPDTALHWQQHVPLVNALVAPEFTRAHFNEAIPEVNLQKWRNEVKHVCRMHNCRSVIVSSEFFWASPAMQLPLEFHVDNEKNIILLDRAIQRFHQFLSELGKVVVIVYLRRQDSWLESFFNQQIKDGFPIPDEKELLPVKLYLLYHKNLELWARYFGADNVVVKAFEEKDGDIVPDFCNLVGIDYDDSFASSKEKQETRNRSLSPQAVRIMRLAIEENLPDSERAELRTLLLSGEADRFFSENQWSQTGLFSESFLAQIHTRYHEDTQQLVNAYPHVMEYLKPSSPGDHAFGNRNTDRLKSMPQDQKLLEMLLNLTARPNDHG